MAHGLLWFSDLSQSHRTFHEATTAVFDDSCAAYAVVSGCRVNELLADLLVLGDETGGRESCLSGCCQCQDCFYF